MPASSRPFTFGFGIFPYARFGSVSEVVDVVQCGEALGFDAVGLPEHLLPPRWPDADVSTKFWYDLPTLAAFLAGATTHLRFLTSVLVVPYHHPVGLAKALATLDVLSNGRILCGVGAGWMQAEFRRLGIPFAERGAITDEYLGAMKELWTAESPSFAGKYVSFNDVSFLPRPVQRPHIPLLIGGTGPRPLRRVAELGDGWFPITATIAQLESGVAEVKEAMARLGRDSSRLWVGYTGFAMGSDPETARMRHNVGRTRVQEDATREAVSALERSPDDAIAEIARLRAAGVTHLPVGFAWRTAAELMAGMQRFARDVMPAFAAT